MGREVTCDEGVLRAHVERVAHLLCVEALDWSRNSVVRAEAIRAATDERLDALVGALVRYGCADAREQVREVAIRWAARVRGEGG